jgi:ATP-dependent RNA helicase DHX8/PRP22
MLVGFNLPKCYADTGLSAVKGVLQDFEICPLYAALPPDEQMRVFEPSPPGVRKFILATNIAETSVTISGIKYVVDTGFVKSRLLQEISGFEMLKVTSISQSQANQRAGRAGRESEGKCFRLYTEDVFEGSSVPTCI